MAERSKHLFQFTADKIAKCAKHEAVYHRERQTWWRQEYDKAVATVKATAKIEVRVYPVTGGDRADLNIDYGDVAAYKRMQEAWDKLCQHRKAAEAFATDAEVYGSQGERVYELDAADVLHYRLGGGTREE
jgi:hypothetical protein